MYERLEGRALTTSAPSHSRMPLPSCRCLGLGQLVTGALSDRLGRKWLIAAGMGVQAAAIGWIAAAYGFAAWVIGALLLGAGTAMVYPTLLAVIGDVAHPTWRASTVGIYRLWRNGGFAVGALLAGLIADWLGLTAASGIAVALRMYETHTPRPVHHSVQERRSRRSAGRARRRLRSVHAYDGQLTRDQVPDHSRGGQDEPVSRRPVRWGWRGRNGTACPPSLGVRPLRTRRGLGHLRSLFLLGAGHWRRGARLARGPPHGALDRNGDHSQVSVSAAGRAPPRPPGGQPRRTRRRVPAIPDGGAAKARAMAGERSMAVLPASFRWLCRRDIWPWRLPVPRAYPDSGGGQAMDIGRALACRALMRTDGPAGEMMPRWPQPPSGRGAEHADEHRPAERGSRERRALLAALIANAALLVIEAAGGLVFGSLVLLADAGHLLADVSALGVSAAVLGLARRRPTARHTFGFERAEVLAAQVNALLLVAVMAWIAQDAVRRLAAPPPVRAGGMLAVAITALAVNGASSVMLARAAGRSLNMRGAWIHLAVDAAGSLTAVAAAAVMLGWGLRSADPVASLVTAVLAAWAVYGLIRDTTHVLMEGAPRGLDPEQVLRALLEHRHVVSVHHLHLWCLASDVPALSAHVVLAGNPSVADAQRCASALRAVLADRFGIVNVTLELECEPQTAGPADGPRHPGDDQMHALQMQVVQAPGPGGS